MQIILGISAAVGIRQKYAVGRWGFPVSRDHLESR